MIFFGNIYNDLFLQKKKEKKKKFHYNSKVFQIYFGY